MDDLLRRLERAHRLYVDLVAGLTPELLASHLGDLRSNTIAEQLWCVVGARESYTKAALEGGWQGFTSSLDASSPVDPSVVVGSLNSSFAVVSSAIDAGVAPEGRAWLMDLLEHETQHHGQLIRYLYGLGIPRPQSWREHYALD
jgi:hypothetical protein